MTDIVLMTMIIIFHHDSKSLTVWQVLNNKLNKPHIYLCISLAIVVLFHMRS